MMFVNNHDNSHDNSNHCIDDDNINNDDHDLLHSLFSLKQNENLTNMNLSLEYDFQKHTSSEKLKTNDN